MLNKKELLDGFGQLNLKKGETIIVHTSYKSLGGVEGGAETVIDVMRELVGKEGTVMFPAFNFQSWTETHYWDVQETPSKMGMITELARPGLTRCGLHIRSTVSPFGARARKSFQRRKMWRRMGRTRRSRCSIRSMGRS